jgi:hypothetical protein
MKRFTTLLFTWSFLIVGGCGETTNPDAPPPQDPAIGFAEAVRVMISDFKRSEDPGSMVDSFAETVTQYDEMAADEHKPIYAEMEAIAKEMQEMRDGGAGEQELMEKVNQLEQLAQKLPGKAPDVADEPFAGDTGIAGPPGGEE